jgi:hypothetical protein
MKIVFRGNVLPFDLLVLRLRFCALCLLPRGEGGLEVIHIVLDGFPDVRIPNVGVFE